MIGCFSRLLVYVLLASFFMATYGYIMAASNSLELTRTDGRAISEKPFWEN